MLLSEPILVALPRDHRLARRKCTALRALASEPIVLMEEGHCLRDQELSVCEAAGLTNRRDDVQAAGFETLRQMVMAGIGVALIPELATLPPFGSDGLAVYRRFELPVPRRELVLAWRRSFPRGDALQDLARGLRAALAAPPPVLLLVTRAPGQRLEEPQLLVEGARKRDQQIVGVGVAGLGGLVDRCV
jgi:LysR family transcriptional regulator, hydrogen peroxide-inducible genes activator